jgi:antitoxin component of MazEF toxin-antitoxin module
MSIRINSNNPNNPLRFEVRRVQQQTTGRSLSVVIPNRYSKRMGLQKGDLLNIRLESGSKLIFEKVNLSSGNQVSTPLALGGVE